MKIFTTTLATIFSVFLLLQSLLVTAHTIPTVRVLKVRDSPTGRCGSQGDGAKCDSYGLVNACCSVNGWCGDSPDHCGSGCQAGFGKCGTGTTAPPNPDTGGRPKVGNVPYGVEIFSCSVPNTYAITYDDGPYQYTADLLDILKRNDVKVTFFVTGNNLEKGAIDAAGSQWAPIIRRMIAEGHQVASHTWDHLDLTELSENDRQFQMTRLETALKSIIGKYPTYMRPPYIVTSPAMLQTMSFLGYHTIIWDLDTDDYNNLDAVAIQKSKALVDDALRAGESNWNSIQHDIHPQTVYSLTEYEIVEAKKKGFRLVTIGECLGDPESNWYRT